MQHNTFIGIFLLFVFLSPTSSEEENIDKTKNLEEIIQESRIIVPAKSDNNFVSTCH